MTHPLTPEQEDICTAFDTGNHLVVQAGAGTGKTTTIEVLADRAADQGKRCIYLAFNKAIAREVDQRFTRGNVQSMTFHSLCWRIANRDPQLHPVLKKLNNPNPLRFFEIADRFDIDTTHSFLTVKGQKEMVKNPMKDIFNSHHQKLTRNAMVGYGLKTVTKWCQSADKRIDMEHVVFPPSMAFAGDELCEEENDMISLNVDEYKEKIVTIARTLWDEDISQSYGELMFGHDHYLKMVSLKRPSLHTALGLPVGSVIFFDEAQDARPAMTSMIYDRAHPTQLVKYVDGREVEPRMQIVAVGDSAQAIYGTFTGARDALPKFSGLGGCINKPLSQSWRFGQDIAKYSNTVLSILDAPIRLKGNPDIDSQLHHYQSFEDLRYVADLDSVIVRSNADLIDALTYFRARGNPVYLNANTSYVLSIVDDVERLQHGKKPKTKDLRDVSTFEELEEYVNNEFVDPQLAVLLHTILKRGVVAIRDAFKYGRYSSVNYTGDKPVVSISTIHKAKGQQWDNVVMYMDPKRDLPHFEDGELDLHSAEVRESLMLLYVALTRARKNLYVPEDVNIFVHQLMMQRFGLHHV